MALGQIFYFKMKREYWKKFLWAQGLWAGRRYVAAYLRLYVSRISMEKEFGRFNFKSCTPLLISLWRISDSYESVAWIEFSKLLHSHNVICSQLYIKKSQLMKPEYVPCEISSAYRVTKIEIESHDSRALVNNLLKIHETTNK